MLCTAVIGALLNVNAGFVNACVWHEFGASTTHMTGIATVSAMALLKAEYTKFALLLLQLALFIAGAFCSSLVVGGQRKFHVSPYYSVVLAAVGSLILVCTALTDKWTVLCTVSFAAGMQNSLATFFSGAVVRTTHVTGTATDIGIELASFVAGRNKDTWKLRLLCYFLFAFFAGAFLGTGCATLWGQHALSFPGSLSWLLSAVSLQYYFMHVKQQPRKIQVEVEEKHHATTREPCAKIVSDNSGVVRRLAPIIDSELVQQLAPMFIAGGNEVALQLAPIADGEEGHD
jgi:uncharacterized membrane protein YoaK (UPF0700 family)